MPEEGLGPAVIENFGGLNLVSDPGEVGAEAAIAGQNFDLDQLGRVRSRSGFVNFTAAEGVNFYDSLFAFHRVGAADTILAGGGVRLESIIGGAVSQALSTNAGPHRFAAFGTATENRVYIANGVDTVRYYKHDEFTTPTYTGTTPTGTFVAVQQPDNRLVVARTDTNRSRVLFSNAGDPHTFEADNYIDLNPGDGEEIRGMVAWREYLFVFKETQFYVFYGNDTDPDSGEEIFNYRAVPGGIRLGHSCVAAQDAVYFLDRRGLYKTTGGEATLISRPVESLFAPLSQPSGDQLASGSNPTLSWADDRLYLCYATVGEYVNNRMLVYHCTDGWFSLWTITGTSVLKVRTSATDALRESLMFARTATAKHIARFSDAITDAGSQIDSHYQLGFLDFGDPKVKTILNTLLDGNGQVSLSCAESYASTPVRPTTVTLGTGGNVSQRRSRTSYRGRNFSFKVASVNGSSWQINRIVPNLRSTSPSGVGQ